MWEPKSWHSVCWHHQDLNHAPLHQSTWSFDQYWLALILPLYCIVICNFNPLFEFKDSSSFAPGVDGFLDKIFMNLYDIFLIRIKRPDIIILSIQIWTKISNLNSNLITKQLSLIENCQKRLDFDLFIVRPWHFWLNFFRFNQKMIKNGRILKLSLNLNPISKPNFKLSLFVVWIQTSKFVLSGRFSVVTLIALAYSISVDPCFLFSGFFQEDSCDNGKLGNVLKL